ncbi:MAG: PBP1A family penicillin-binding protein [Pseudomonadota bacterium]
MLLPVFRFVGFVFSWAVIGLVFAVVVVGGVIWSYGPDLPDHAELSAYEPLTLSRVYDGNGEVLDEFVRERRVFTPYDEIPDLVKDAFISAEDKNFYNHWGFDPRGMASAFLDAAQGARLRGASTITQQVVKNFLLDGSREVERKIKEVILAVKLEGVLNKDQILELYLNEIFLGQNSFGVTAAARNYFGKTLEELTPAEAAYLAALPKAPSRRHPVRHLETALFWRNNTLREMAENGYITPEERDLAQASPLETVIGGELTIPEEAVLPGRSYFTDEVRRQIIREVGEEELFTGGLTIRATVDPLYQEAARKALQRGLIRYDQERGGYAGPVAKLDPEELTTEEDWRAALASARIPRDIENWRPAVVTLVGNSSVRVGIEGVAEDDDGHYVLLRNSQWVRNTDDDGNLEPAPETPADVWELGDVIYVEQLTDEEGDPFWMMRQVPRVQGAFMAMDSRTGRVLALQGGFDFTHSAFNRATQATRQPGSAFKPFVYAAALDQGFTPATIVMDAPYVYGDILSDEERLELEEAGEEIEELWTPKNYSGRFYGPQLMRVGIERSLNLMTVRIADAIGMRTVADYGEGFGIYDYVPPDLTYALGSGETTLYRLVAAYAQFANGGLKVEPTLVDRVQDRRGNTIYIHEPRVCEGCGSLEPGDEGIPTIVDEAERVMSDITAFQLISMLEGVVDRGTARSALGDLDYPLAGKTGTTNDSRDAWFVGFTPSMVAGCFVGFDVPTALDAGGGSLCAPIFRDFMDVVIANETTDPGTFQPPNTGVLIKMERETGIRLPDETLPEEADFTIEVFPEDQVPEVYAEVQRGIGLAEGFTFEDLPETLSDPNLLPSEPGANLGPATPAAPGGLSDGGGLY